VSKLIPVLLAVACGSAPEPPPAAPTRAHASPPAERRWFVYADDTGCWAQEVLACADGAKCRTPDPVAIAKCPSGAERHIRENIVIVHHPDQPGCQLERTTKACAEDHLDPCRSPLIDVSCPD